MEKRSPLTNYVRPLRWRACSPPETLYFLPEVTGTSSYLNDVPATDIGVVEDVCCESPDTNAADTFAELAQIIMDENGLEMPSNPQSALDLY